VPAIASSISSKPGTGTGPSGWIDRERIRPLGSRTNDGTTIIVMPISPEEILNSEHIDRIYALAALHDDGDLQVTKPSA